MSDTPECILFPEQYQLLYKTSYLQLFTFFYAIYMGHTGISICPCGVFITSILFWQKPMYDWRRDLDMIYVKFALAYQLYRAFNAEYGKHYWALMILGTGCYYAGVYYYHKKNYWYSTYCHLGLHFFASVSNICLYSGEIGPPLFI